MKQFICLNATVLLLFLYLSAFSRDTAQDSTFQDPFDGAFSWISATGSKDFTDSYKDGFYTVKAAAANQAFLKRSLLPQQKYSSFSLNATFKIKSANANSCGILFCWQSELQGYMFTVYATRQYTFGKWVKTATGYSFVSIASGFNSFINPVDNVLGVSKSGDALNLICNGAVICRTTATDYQSGDIGLFVGNNEEVAFDHLIYTNRLSTAGEKEYFSDNFNDNDFIGWMRHSSETTFGNWKAEGGVLKIAADQQEIIYTNGKYAAKPCTTIVTTNNGTANDAFYGIAYLLIEPNKTVQSFSFLLNGVSKQYAIGSGSLQTKPHSAIHGTTDTLIVTPDYGFIINGFPVDTLKADPKPSFNAVGFLVLKGSQVSFDDFRVGVYTPNTPILHNPFVKNGAMMKQSYIIGGAGIIIDSKGRTIGSFEGNQYPAALRSLGNGPYYIIQRNNKEYILRKAIVNIK